MRAAYPFKAGITDRRFDVEIVPSMQGSVKHRTSYPARPVIDRRFDGRKSLRTRDFSAFDDLDDYGDEYDEYDEVEQMSLDNDIFFDEYEPEFRGYLEPGVISERALSAQPFHSANLRNGADWIMMGM